MTHRAAHTLYPMPATAGLTAWFVAEPRKSVDSALINGQPSGH
jgi:hypothetical protein